MTPIILPIAELKPALLGLSKVVAKRTTLPVLSTIRIDRDPDGRLSLSATDLDAFVTARLFVANETQQPCTLLVPFTALNSIAKACRGDDELQITPDSQNHVSIRYPIASQTAAQRVESYPLEEWPPIPRLNGAGIPVQESLRSALLEAMQCASTDETRYILRGACIDVSDRKCHHVVGTDGRHLYSSNSFSLPLAESLVIPDHKFLAWRGFADDGEWTLQVGGQKDAAWLRLDSRYWTLIVKPIEGTYPNWRQVVPGKDACKSRVVFPEDIGPVIEAVQKLPDHDKINHAIGIKLEKRRLTLLGRDAADARFTEIVFPDADTKGEPVTIFLNRNFLTKALRFGLRELQILDPLSALRFTADGRQMVVMPVRPDAEKTTPVPAKSPEAPAANTNPPPPEEAQQERNTSMRQINGSAHGAPTGGALRSTTTPAPPEKPALETALTQVEIVRGDFRNAIAGLNKLGEALKAAQREHKTADKEVQAARQTLEKLQSVRI